MFGILFNKWCCFVNIFGIVLILVYICLLNKHFVEHLSIINIYWGTSLVAQWLRICLPMQGTRVWALIREDPTCRRATKPVRHNYWGCALEPASHSYWALVPQLLKPACLEPVLCNKKSTYCNEEYPPLAATRESLCAATKTQCGEKKKKKAIEWLIWQMLQDSALRSV